MTEWAVLGVIITALGFVATCSVPIVYVVKAITKQNAVSDAMIETMNRDRQLNQKSHEKLWAHIEEQDETLNDHEVRIQLMEKGK